MLEFEERHAKYDAALEVLCSLPRHPAAASLEELARDFGYDDPQAITKLIMVLIRRGYLIDRFSKDDEPYASVRPIGWRHAARDSERYWLSVYRSQKDGTTG